MTTRQDQIDALSMHIAELALMQVQGFLITTGGRQWEDFTEGEQHAADLGAAAGATIGLQVLLDRGIDILADSAL